MRGTGERTSKGFSAAIATLIIASTVIAGCGGGSSSGSQLRKTGAISKGEAAAYAHAVNLGVADVPGMVSVSLEGEHKDESSRAEAKCGIRESHVHVVDIQSPKFKSGEGLQLAEVKSDVEVVPTAAMADRKLAQIKAAMQSRSVRACLGRVLAQALARGFNKRRNRRLHIAIGHTRISVLHPTVPDSFGVRIVFPLTLAANGVVLDMRVYTDASGFVVGPAAITLTSLGFSRPVATEEHLLSVLYGRAKS